MKSRALQAWEEMQDDMVGWAGGRHPSFRFDLFSLLARALRVLALPT